MTDQVSENPEAAGGAPLERGVRPHWLRTEYRIVEDCYLGYEVQIRRWWWPFWTQPQTNTHHTIERAERWAKNHARGHVKYLGRIGA